jgi:fluoride exporter
MINNILLVGLGGGLGSVARYLCQRWVSQLYPHSFPYGTLAVNVIGCLLIGIFWAFSLKHVTDAAQWKLFLMTGLCGGFTTFSAFTLEGINLLKEQRTGLFFWYVGLSILAGLAATYVGIKLIKQ